MIQFKNANLYLIQNLRGMKEELKNKTLITRKLTRYQVTNNDYNKAYSSTSYLISLHRLFSLIPLSFKNIDFAEVFDVRFTYKRLDMYKIQCKDSQVCAFGKIIQQSLPTQSHQ